MTQTYYAENGESLDVNISGNQILDKLTFGLWDKIGIPRPISSDDAKLIARILRNAATFCRNGHPLFLSIAFNGTEFNYRDNGEVQWLDDTAGFFERSGGLITEREHDQRMSRML